MSERKRFDNWWREKNFVELLYDAKSMGKRAKGWKGSTASLYVNMWMKVDNGQKACTLNPNRFAASYYDFYSIRSIKYSWKMSWILLHGQNIGIFKGIWCFGNWDFFPFCQALDDRINTTFISVLKAWTRRQLAYLSIKKKHWETASPDLFALKNKARLLNRICQDGKV